MRLNPGPVRLGVLSDTRFKLRPDNGTLLLQDFYDPGDTEGVPLVRAHLAIFAPVSARSLGDT